MEISCPICSLDLNLFTQDQRVQHCNKCLDKPNSSINQSQLKKRKCSAQTQLTFGNSTPKVTPTKRQSKQPLPPVKRKPYEIANGSGVQFKQEFSIPDATADSSIEIIESPKVDESSTKPMNNESEESVGNVIDNENEELFVDEDNDQEEPIPKPSPRYMPFYKRIYSRISGNYLAVDAFCYGPVPDVNMYFLSHFHYDHYTKLNSKWNHGPIYCSPATARLVLWKLKVNPEYVVPLETNIDHVINGLKVRLLDANHCPGAVIFLFDDSILHTGDFRADAKLVAALKSLNLHLDVTYLDTTYLDPLRKFPSQSKVIDLCSKHVLKQQLKPGLKSFFTKERPRRVLVMVGTYTIGKERIALGICKSLNTKIYAAGWKRMVLQVLEDAEFNQYLSTNEHECQVHLTGMGDIKLKNLEKKLSENKRHFTHVIGIIPTGWTWGKTQTFDDNFFEQREVTSTNKEGTVLMYRVPYSEHSSYEELELFCKEVPAKKIISTVTTKNKDILKSWECR